MGAALAARRSGWRLLGLFWVVVAGAACAGLATLQLMGPPAPAALHGEVAHGEVAHGDAAAEAHPAAATPEPAAHAPLPTTPVVTPAAGAAPATPKIPGPVASLQEPSRAVPGAQVPRVGADGRMARIVYAAPAPVPAPGLVRVALLAGSFGLSDRDSRAAIEQWPGAVSFAVSAYAPDPGALLAAARDAGHEVLDCVPMEPQGYPLNDEGSRSLRTGLPPEENRTNLEWALSRTPGAVGATGASDGMRGERFADISAVFDPVVDEVTRRGLLYVDARPGRAAAQPGAVRAVDIVLDDQPGRADLDAALLSLERTAKEKGAAIGLVGTLRPLTIERVAAWAKTLQERGMVLMPVSALVNK